MRESIASACICRLFLQHSRMCAREITFVVSSYSTRKQDVLSRRWDVSTRTVGMKMSAVESNAARHRWHGGTEGNPQLYAKAEGMYSSPHR